MWMRSRRCSSRARAGIAAATLLVSLPAAAQAAAAAGDPGSGSAPAIPAAALWATASPAATGAAPEGIPALAAEILSDARYQKEIPDGEIPFRLPFLETSPLVRTVIIVGLLFLAGVLIAWIVNLLLRGEERPGRGEEAAPEGGGAGRGLRGGDPSRLAAQGRFDEAVHALLLSALGHLLREADQEPRPSATMREILRQLPLQGERRRALGDLIRHVEISLFGGRAAGPEDYTRCLESFRLLVPAGAS